MVRLNHPEVPRRLMIKIWKDSSIKYLKKKIGEYFQRFDVFSGLKCKLTLQSVGRAEGGAALQVEGRTEAAGGDSIPQLVSHPLRVVPINDYESGEGRTRGKQ